MRKATGLALMISLAAGGSACKDPETAAAEAKQRSEQNAIADGRAKLAAGQYRAAARAFNAATSYVPLDPAPVLLLAEAEREDGNDAAAILALKHAAEMVKSTPLSQDKQLSIKLQLAELYVRFGSYPEAIRVYSELRDAQQLNDDGILALAKLQAQQGDFDGAFETLKRIQLKRPDDPRAKVVEAEILLLSGEELLAARLMDRLVMENNLAAARILRAQYFLNAGYPDNALADIAGIKGQEAQTPEAVGLLARALNDLKRYDEAEKELRALLQNAPNDPYLLSELANTKVNEGQVDEAQAYVDQALSARPRFARALYVRGRTYESTGDLKLAAESYEDSLRSDPALGSALSRLWRIYQRKGDKTSALLTLERLFLLNQASMDEKGTLADMYMDTRIHLERARHLCEEILRRDPENTHFRDLRLKILKALGIDPNAIQIIRGPARKQTQ